MSYASASNISTQTCIINNVAFSGSGFGITPDNEGVFIPSRIMEHMALGVGDRIRVFCSDNHADPETRHLPARWKALRVTVEERFADKPDADIHKNAMQKPKTKRDGKSLTAEQVCAEVDLLLAKEQPWSVSGLAAELEDLFPSLQPSGVETMIKAYMDKQFSTARVAKAVIFVGPFPGTQTVTYYAASADVLDEYLNTAIED